MNLRRYATTVAVVASAAVPAAMQDQALRVGDAVFTVSGTVVTASAPVLPVRHVTVTIRDQTQTSADRSTLTDDDGRFRFDGIQAGVYRVVARKPAFLAAEYGSVTPGGAGVALEVPGGAPPSGLTIVLYRGAVLAGTVLDVDGQPAAYVTVSAESTPASAVQTLTNFRGEYRIYGLMPGDYLVSAEPPRAWQRFASPALVTTAADIDRALSEVPGPTTPRVGRVARVDDASTDGAPSITGYSPIYYPGTAVRTAAVPVSVGTGDERTGLNLQLILAGRGRIRGMVLGAAGEPVGNAFVSATHGDLTGWAVGQTSSSQGGGFELLNVPPGSYTVLAVARLNRDRQAGAAEGHRTVEWWGVTELYVGGEAVDGVILNLQPPLRFEGRIVLADALAEEASSLISDLHISLARVRGGVVASGPATASTRVQPDGRFSIDVTPGLYRLSAAVGSSLPARWSLRSAVADGRDLLDAPLEIGPATGDFTDVVLTLSRRGTALSGRLLDARGTAATDCYVLAFPVNTAWRYAGSRRVKWTRPTTTGTYELRDLPSGDYHLVVLTADVFDGSLLGDPEFLDEAEGWAVPVSIAEGASVIQDLGLRSPRAE